MSNTTNAPESGDLPPVVADAFELLRVDLLRHLEPVEFLAECGEPWTEAEEETARELLPSLALIIRCVVMTHQVDEAGGCRECPSGRAWPCAVVANIHQSVKDPTGVYSRLIRSGRW
jgi:hypothetical protein